MTKEQLLDKFDHSAFAESYGYSRGSLSLIMDDALNEKFCHKAVNYICDKFSNILPGEDEMIFDQNHPRYKEQLAYWRVRDDCLFSSGWMDEFRQLWIETNGKLRTTEEASKMAADAWCQHIFVSIYQDNGANNDNLTTLGMYLKVKAQDRVTQEMIDKVHQGIYDFYYEHQGNSMCNILFVDYAPCAALHDIMKNAGIDEKDIESLCPWKSHLKIDPDDNSICCAWNYSEKEMI